MPRRRVHEEPLMVKLDPELKRRLRVEAARSDTDMSKLVRALIVAELDRLEAERNAEAGRGRRLVEHMTGRAAAGVTTEEIMTLTRGED